jgi:two-component system sensor histidine kinase/response regulator
MRKILVIDDDDLFRASLTALLQKSGFDVVQAATGGSGIQLARDHSPDLILCDVSMAGADGRLTLYALRRDPHIASIPFVLMSGVVFSGEALPGTGRRADGFLSKPFSAEKLRATIETCLNQVQPSTGAVAPGQAIHSDSAASLSSETMLQSLDQILESTKRLTAADSHAAPEEIRRLAKRAHQSALRLKNLIQEQTR